MSQGRAPWQPRGPLTTQTNNVFCLREITLVKNVPHKLTKTLGKITLENITCRAVYAKRYLFLENRVSSMRNNNFTAPPPHAVRPICDSWAVRRQSKNHAAEKTSVSCRRNNIKLPVCKNEHGPFSSINVKARPAHKNEIQIWSPCGRGL